MVAIFIQVLSRNRYTKLSIPLLNIANEIALISLNVTSKSLKLQYIKRYETKIAIIYELTQNNLERNIMTFFFWSS